MRGRRSLPLKPMIRKLTGEFREPCQGKVEMSYSLQSRNVLFPKAGEEVHVSLIPSVKRRRAMLASNPIED